MIKSLTRHGNSYALIIDRAILELLHLRPETPLELSTDGTALIIRPAPRSGTAHRRGRPETAPRRAITLTDLKERRDEILTLAARHGATNVRVFGSVVRGAAQPDSDVDMLVTFADDRSLFDQTSLIRKLTELLERDVDVVSDRGLHPRVRDRILDEAVPL